MINPQQEKFLSFFFGFFSTETNEPREPVDSLPSSSFTLLDHCFCFPSSSPPISSELRLRHHPRAAAAGLRRRAAASRDQSESLSMLSIPFRPRCFCFLGHFFSRTTYLLLVTSVSHIPGQIKLTALSTFLGLFLGRCGSLVPFMARKSSSFSLRDSVV
uniref:Uncharacterized protein n=1 Tax=Arundo donax TaxID=35708 RepID=A0A0A9E6X5_ARUDO